jgi:aspartate/methionine/tyrosine aminotransferase
MVAPDHLFMDLKKIQDTILICPPVISQWAAVGALKAGRSYCRPKIANLAHVRHMVMRRLAGLERLVKVPPASGAFYFFFRVDTDMNAMTLVERLVREYRVAVIPGTTFGETDGRFLRVPYGALQTHTVEEGMERLVGGLTDIVGGGKRKQEPLPARANQRDSRRAKTANGRTMR